MEFERIVEGVGKAVDGVGVAVIVLGVGWALLRYGIGLRPQIERTDAYRATRRSVGRAVLLGLEVLVAGDIIRTVAVSPSFTSVGILAIIVGIRTFLSFTLEMEISSRWPWQQQGSVSGTSE